MTQPLAGMAIVLGVLAGLFGALTLYRRLAAPHPELLRKLLHMGMGLTTLSFPWLFDRAWPVLVLGVLSVALLVSLRKVPRLRSTLGQVVNSVERFSLGEIYFPLAVAVLWGLYLEAPREPESRRLLGYVIPLLLLTLSDALAALVGVAYGRLRFSTVDGMKSIEGSLAFFLCSFVCVHVPLLLLTDRGRPETLLIAVLLAWLATMFEATAWAGLDNIILPLAAHLMLLAYWDLSPGPLSERLAVTAGLTVFAVALYRWTPLRGSAILAASLLGYIFWTLGGWHWLTPPLLLFTASAGLSLRYPATKDKTLTAVAVASVTSAGMVWLFVAVVGGRDWCFASTVSFAAHLGMVTLGRLRLTHPTASVPVLLAVCAGAGWLLMLTPYVLFHSHAPLAVREALLGLPAVALAVVGFSLTQPGMEDCPFDLSRWVRQAVWAAVASTLAAVVLVLQSGIP